MKKILISILSLFFILSCSKNEDIPASLQDKDHDMQNELMAKFGNASDTSAYHNFAVLFSSIDINKDICDEVKKAVDLSISCGFDESLILKDIQPQTKAGNDYLSLPVLYSRIKAQTFDTKSGSGSDSLDIEALLHDPSVQIYWPYSENWDGISLPTITFAPDDDDQEWNYGVKQIRENGETVRSVVYVDEDYAMANPVWVICKNSIPYDYILKIRNMINDGHGDMNTKSSDLHPWILDQVKLTKQYDGLFSAGNNIKISITIPPTTGSAGGVNAIYFTILRKYARNDGTWVSVNRTLNDNWSAEQITNHMLMVETDDGSTRTISFSNQYRDDNGHVVSVGQSVTCSDEDDIINQWLYYRESIMNNGASYQYQTSDGKTYLKMHID